MKRLTPRQFGALAAKAITGQPRLFDWAHDCPDAVGRAFPPVAGPGRGEVLEPYVCVRCGRESFEPFKWAHRPLNSDRRTCGGKVVRRSQVVRTRAEQDRKMIASLMQIAKQESGWQA